MISQMKSPERSSIFRIYGHHTARHPWLFASVIAGMLAAQAAILSAPLYLRTFIDTLAAGGSDAVPVLVSTLGILIFIWVVNWAADRIRYFATVYLEANVMPALMQSAFRHLIGVK